MDRYPFILFLSDFGPGLYPAACEALLVSLVPGSRVVHVTHDIEPGDVRAAGLTLARVAPLGPPAVHLAVVDPGVGTPRSALALHAERGDFLVGPDNGLLLPAARALGGITSAWALDAEHVRSQAGLDGEPSSATFHARDLFAPAAGLLARGALPGIIGETVPVHTLVEAASYAWSPTSQGIRTDVVELDRFGNVGLAVLRSEIEVDPARGSNRAEIRIEGRPERAITAHAVRTFGDLDPGVLGLIADSWGRAALVKNGESAARQLDVSVGDVVELRGVSALASGGICP